MVTDYDAWHEEHGRRRAVDPEGDEENSSHAARLVARLARDFPAEHEPCPAGSEHGGSISPIVTAAGVRDRR